MKKGDRVKNDFLGEGVIIDIFNEKLCTVKFDKNPPYEYNLEINPCLAFFDELELI